MACPTPWHASLGGEGGRERGREEREERKGGGARGKPWAASGVTVGPGAWPPSPLGHPIPAPTGRVQDRREMSPGRLKVQNGKEGGYRETNTHTQSTQARLHTHKGTLLPRLLPPPSLRAPSLHVPGPVGVHMPVSPAHTPCPLARAHAPTHPAPHPALSPCWEGAGFLLFGNDTLGLT